MVRPFVHSSVHLVAGSANAVIFSGRPDFRQSTCPSIHPSFLPSTRHSVRPFVLKSVRPFFPLSVLSLIRLFHCPSVCLSVVSSVRSASVLPSVRLSIRPNALSFVLPSVHPSFRLSSFLPSVHLFFRSSVRPSVSPSVFPSFHPSILHFVRTSIAVLPFVLPTIGPFVLQVRPSVFSSIPQSARSIVHPRFHPFIGSSVRSASCSLVHLFVHSRVCPSVHSSVCHSGLPSFHPLFRSSGLFRPPGCQPVRSSVRPYVRKSVRPSVRLSVRPCVRPSVRPYVRPRVHPSARRSSPNVCDLRPLAYPDSGGSPCSLVTTAQQW